MGCTEIQHLLCFRNTSDGGTGKVATWKNQVERSHRQRVFGHSYECKRAVQFQEVQVSVDVMLGRNGIKDKIEAGLVFLHGVGILGNNNLVRAEAEAIGDLAGRSGEQYHMRAESAGEFYSHVTKSAQSNNANLLARAYFPMSQWRVGGDACTEQRSGGSQIQSSRHAQDKRFIHDNIGGVPAVSLTTEMFVGAVVRERCAGKAELFSSILAIFTGMARINHAAHCADVTCFKFGHAIAHAFHAANDFVPRHTGINGIMPFIAGLMQIRVANTAIENFDFNVGWAGFATGDVHRIHRGNRALRSVSFYIGRCHNYELNILQSVKLSLAERANLLAKCASRCLRWTDGLPQRKVAGVKTFGRIFLLSTVLCGFSFGIGNAFAQVARSAPAKYINSTQIFYYSPAYFQSLRKMYPFLPDSTLDIWREVTDTNTISYIARANGLTAADLTTVIIAPLHTNELALYQIRKPDKAFNVLEGQIQEYIRGRHEGHSRMFLLTALSDHWQTSKITDPDLRAIMASQSWVAVSWLKKARSGSYTNGNQVMHWAAYTLVDGPAAWTCLCEFNPAGQVDSFRMERIDPGEVNPQYQPVIEQVSAQVEAEMKQQGTYGKMGAIHTFWQQKKARLKARGIDWHSPDELNPNNNYD